MAFIDYIAEDGIPSEDLVPDRDNILRIHGIHSRTMRQHYDLYRELMYRKGPLIRNSLTPSRKGAKIVYISLRLGVKI